VTHLRSVPLWKLHLAPADERLDADDAAVGEPDDGLVVQLELAARLAMYIAAPSPACPRLRSPPRSPRPR
jgi:hypothetical protein